MVAPGRDNKRLENSAAGLIHLSQQGFFYSSRAFENNVSPFSLYSQCGHLHAPGEMVPGFGMTVFRSPGLWDDCHPLSSSISVNPLAGLRTLIHPASAFRSGVLCGEQRVESTPSME